MASMTAVTVRRIMGCPFLPVSTELSRLEITTFEGANMFRHARKCGAHDGYHEAVHLAGSWQLDNGISSGKSLRMTAHLTVLACSTRVSTMPALCCTGSTVCVNEGEADTTAACANEGETDATASVAITIRVFMFLTPGFPPRYAGRRRGSLSRDCGGLFALAPLREPRGKPRRDAGTDPSASLASLKETQCAKNPSFRLHQGLGCAMRGYMPSGPSRESQRVSFSPLARWPQRRALFGVAFRKNELIATISRKHPSGSDGKVLSLCPFWAFPP